METTTDTYEAIVRTLADGFAPTDQAGQCALCDPEVGDHAPDCPWMRARAITQS